MLNSEAYGSGQWDYSGKSNGLHFVASSIDTFVGKLNCFPFHTKIYYNFIRYVSVTEDELFVFYLRKCSIAETSCTVIRSVHNFKQSLLVWLQNEEENIYRQMWIRFCSS